eukprot:15038030-Ditylum_brightwellii.AAC.1
MEMTDTKVISHLMPALKVTIQLVKCKEMVMMIMTKMTKEKTKEILHLIPGLTVKMILVEFRKVVVMMTEKMAKESYCIK